jgi:putative endonuclease
VTTTHEVGVAGEETAARYLRGLGYIVRERNTRFGKHEIDIVAYDPAEEMIVFVEVKTRRSHSEQYPIHTAVNQKKRRALRKAIAKWIFRHQYEGPGRIDVISVSDGNVVEHIVNVGSDFS